jgi:phosphoesterase RecJ-like protein
MAGVLGEVKGVQVWVTFVEEENEIRVRLRSKRASIHTVAHEFGGGGHPRAAACTIHEWSRKETIMKRIQEVVANQ